jgi:hypothetical protein
LKAEAALIGDAGDADKGDLIFRWSLAGCFADLLEYQRRAAVVRYKGDKLRAGPTGLVKKTPGISFSYITVGVCGGP